MTLYQAAAESLASEHASRLASMQTAERNIRERLEELMRELRQMRQRLITEELLDLVAGYEVLEGKPCRFSTSAGTRDELAVPFRIWRFVGNHAHMTVFPI